MAVAPGRYDLYGDAPEAVARHLTIEQAARWLARSTLMLDYIRDGQAIYRASFATIRAEANLSAVPADPRNLPCA